jgi:uncharacterized membrane protein YjjP (DUF1212 family)
MQDLQTGTMSLADSSARLDAIDKMPPPWGKLASMLGYAVVAVTIIVGIMIGYTITRPEPGL